MVSKSAPEDAPQDAPKADALTSRLSRKGTAARPIELLLRVEGASSTPAVLRLGAERCSVGSASSCDMVVHDATVSRVHLELHLVAEGVRVRDVGSSNGTYYLGQRVESAVLQPGAALEIGGVRLCIEPDRGSLDGLEPLEQGAYHGLLGRSLPMRRLYAALQRLEGSLVSVLLEGESGTGKELVAQALHRASKLATGPLVTVNCGAIHENLVASELFGHRRGAFTGAAEHRRGAFDEADGGTLFLDEIGELPLALQPALLRALETGEIRPLGAERAHLVKARVIAATHRDLLDDVSHGRFREDLYYRLAVVRLRVPPLRERMEDIALLAAHFAERGDAALPAEVLEALKSRSYRGNVRELRNVVQAYLAMGSLDVTQASSRGVLEHALTRHVDVSRPYAELKDELVDAFTRLYVRALLERTSGNQSAAARLAGLDRTHFGRLVAKAGRSDEQDR